MNLRKLIGKNEILSGSDRGRLEELEKGCADLSAEREKISAAWPADANDREARIRAAAAEYAEKPNPHLLEKISDLARLPANADARNWILEALEAERRKRMAPAHRIVRETFRKAEEHAVVERARLVKAEQAESNELGVPWVASPRVRALEEKIIGFRREIAVPLPAEVDGPCPEPAPWRERLAAFL